MNRNSTDTEAANDKRPPVTVGQLVVDPVGQMTACKVDSVERDTTKYFSGEVGWVVSATCVRTGEAERWVVGPDYVWTTVELVNDSCGWRPAAAPNASDGGAR